MPLTPRSRLARRSVPAGIQRPGIRRQAGADPLRQPDDKTPETIEKMRIAGRIAADALATAGAAVAPGVTTDELDRIGHGVLVRPRRLSSTLGCRG